MEQKGFAAKILTGSKLMWFVLMLTTYIPVVVVFYGIKSFQSTLLLLVLISVPIVFFFVYRKALIYEFLVTVHFISSTLGFFKWYSKVDDNLYLGAIPILPVHFSHFNKQMNIDAILSVVEPFEYATYTMLGRAIQPEVWEKAGKTHKWLSCPDFTAPSFDLLEEGAEFINRHLSEGRSVYVHCKSGMGRSACMVLAYFIKYRKDEVNSAHRDLKKSRNVIFNNPSHQFRAMQQYAFKLRPKNVAPLSS